MSHSANFKRVVCPAEITAKTGCIRNDDKVLARGGSVSAAQSLTSPCSTSTMALFAAMIIGLISI